MAAGPARVALIASSYSPYVGGVEEHVRRVARLFADRGVEVEIWTVDRGEHLGTRFVDGVKVRYLPTPLPARKGEAIYSFIRTAPSAWREWREAHAEFRPELLHVQCFGPNGIYALALSRRTGVPLAVTAHGETLADDGGVFGHSMLARRGLTEALKRSEFVTAPSQFALADLRDGYGLLGGTVIPNGVDLNVEGSHLLADEDGPYFTAVGRLGWMKGFDLLIDAFSRAELPTEYRLIIGGDGPESPALARLITDKGLQRRVALIGRLTPEEVSRLMAGSIAVVVPSRVEAFGIVALEAWRAGAPLVMTNRGGAPEFIEDGVDGLLVDPVDTEALVAALQNVAADARLRARLAEAGSARVGAFTWDKVADAYLRLYANVPPTAAVSLSRNRQN
jgi:glycogen(starch) synthase